MITEQELDKAKVEIGLAFDEIAARFNLTTTEKLQIVGDLLHYYLDDLKP